jgi:hypothetical protein
LSEYKEVNLNTINSGAAIDLFNEEFGKVIDNIMDENTKADTVREIQISVKIKPNKDRSAASTQIQVKSKMAPLKPHEHFFHFANDGHKIKALTHDPGVQDIPGLLDGDPKIKNIKEGI